MHDQEEKRQFDASQPITKKVRTPRGIEKISIRFPSDDEWIERQRKRKIVTKDLGGGKTETTVSNSEEIDADLLSKVRLDDGAIENDGCEAGFIFDSLQSAEVIGDIPFESGQFKVTLRVFGDIETTHVLRMPTPKEEMNYYKHKSSSFDLGSITQSIINLAFCADLYKALSVSNTGYVGTVPVVHQGFMVQVIMRATRKELGENDSEKKS